MDTLHHHKLHVLRRQYPKGCAVELVHMEDAQAPPKGTRGKVVHVDDIGTIHVEWDNGSMLGIVPGVDMVRKLTEEIPKR